MSNGKGEMEFRKGPTLGLRLTANENFSVKHCNGRVALPEGWCVCVVVVMMMVVGGQ